MFEEYFQNQLNQFPLYTTKTKNHNESYKGISKKLYPKWEGWKIIREEKSEGVHITEINNDKLDILVRNFYYMRYLEEKY